MTNSRNIAALSILSLAASWGCVSSPVIAPSDGDIFLNANPSAITLDEFSNPPVTTASIVISALILSVDGVPQPGVSVVFSTDAGTLASSPVGQSPTPLETDDNGFVADTLTLQLGDPSTTTVTARSGSLAKDVVINKTEVSPNRPPFASIDATPTGSALVDQTVIYDGLGSIDPDGDPITCYQWQIETSQNILSPELACVPPNSRCEISQGRFNTIVDREYDMEQATVVVTLRVTDDPAVVCSPSGPAEPLTSFSGQAVYSHDVVCDRFMPIANAGSLTRMVTLSGTPAMASLLFSAANSSGGDSGIQRYDWDCGNGTVVNDGPISITCDYAATGTYNVLLIVTNGCGMSDSATVFVTVD